MASIRRGVKILCEDFHGNHRDDILLPYSKLGLMGVKKFHVR